MRKLRSLVAGLFVGITVVQVNDVLAQDYPVRPIRIVAGSVGSANDFVARLIAPNLLNSLGQSVIVDDRGTIMSIDIVSRAHPDGYTLLIAGNTFWIGPLLQKTSYDPIKDFSPVTLVTFSPNVLIVHPSLAVKSVKDLITYAKAKPGEIKYGSGPTGSGNHLAMELFKSMSGTDIVRIPYKGTGPAGTALVGGEVQLMFDNASAAGPHLKSGRLLALAVGSAKPSSLLPNLPTVAASGLPGYESVSSFGLFAPTGTPNPAITRLNTEIVKVLNKSDVKAQLFNNGQEVVGSLPDQLGGTVKSEIVRLGKVIKDAGIRAD